MTHQSLTSLLPPGHAGCGILALIDFYWHVVLSGTPNTQHKDNKNGNGIPSKTKNTSQNTGWNNYQKHLEHFPENQGKCVQALRKEIMQVKSRKLKGARSRYFRQFQH